MRQSLISPGHSRTGAEWAVILLAGIILLLGILMLIGGAWLIALGGSWYYLVAGIGLIASGWGLLLGSPASVWLYLATYVFTWIWAVWEVGGNGWALVPRVVAPTLFTILVLFCLPVLYRHRQHTRADRMGNRATPDALPAGSPLQRSKEPGRAAERIAGMLVLAIAVAVASTSIAHFGSAQNVASTSAPPARVPVGNDQDWPAYGGTYHALRYSSLDQVNRANVSQLTRLWTFRTGDMPDTKTKGKYSPETTPIEIGGRVYLCSAKNIIISLDAGTGKEWWRYDPQVSDDAIPYGATCRGVVYYKNAAAAPDDPCAERVMEATLDARLIAVDARTGRLCPDFGRGGIVSLTDGIGKTVPGWYGNVAAPTIVRDVIVLGGQVQDGQAEDAPSGVIRAYNVLTGKLAWAWDMGHLDRSGAPPAGETYTRGTPNMWTSAAGDDELGYVYIPLGNSSVDFYGANRKDFENKYSSSLVALDVTTGKEVWHFQTVHYDVWDYDLGSPPTLADVSRKGTRIPAVLLASKQGEIYVLDRRTGEPLFPVEERKVPRGGVEGDKLSPTQPYSGFHTVARPPLTEKDMWGMSPLDQLWCRIQFHRVSYLGEYTPPTSDNHYLQYPGYNGGSDWGGVAVDPVKGILVVNYNNMPNYNRLLPRAEADKLDLEPINVAHEPKQPGHIEYSPQSGAPYALEGNPGWRQWTGLMCTEPPYGGITAIDLATGKTLWDEALGEAWDNGPFGIPSLLPIAIGTPNNGGALVTAGGLIFIAAATDNLLRAIDIDTGKILWTDKLPAGGQATPMTFKVAGRQYIGFMAGGHHFMGTDAGDYVLAYGLPKNAGGRRP